MDEIKIVILETSDIHGSVYPIHYGTNHFKSSGLGNIATLIEQQREEHEHVLLIDNGDLIQGTPFAFHSIKMLEKEPNPMVLLANKLKYDAAVFGNHEFNYGQDVVRKVVAQSEFPWLSANLLDKETGEPFYGKPYMIKEFPGQLKVGILGLTTPYIPNWERPAYIEGIQFADPVIEAKKWVHYLREVEKVDLIIASYHGGFERDLDTMEPTETLTGENQGVQLCMEVEGIDVLLTGHQHRQISGKKINGVIVVQPGHNAETIGKVSLSLKKVDNGWQCTKKDSEILFTSDVKADQTILALAAPYEEATQTWLDQPIGKIEGDMLIHDPMAIRLKDNPFIEFINRVQMSVSDVTISNTALFDNSSLGFPENVTMRDIVSNYVYPNTLTVIRISGRDMKEALERSASYFKQYVEGSIEVNPKFMYPKPQHYNYDMWAGINYLINISKPVGERIVKLEYQGKPVMMDAEFDVVMNNYRAGGGGDYAMFKGKQVIKEIPIDVTELIADYFLKEKTVQAIVRNNWHVIHD